MVASNWLPVGYPDCLLARSDYIHAGRMSSPPPTAAAGEPFCGFLFVFRFWPKCSTGEF